MIRDLFNGGADGLLEAVNVVDAGLKKFPESEKLQKYLEKLKAEAAKAEGGALNNALKGLGYTLILLPHGRAQPESWAVAMAPCVRAASGPARATTARSRSSSLPRSCAPPPQGPGSAWCFPSTETNCWPTRVGSSATGDACSSPCWASP